jgi:hypothetical protein
MAILSSLIRRSGAFRMYQEIEPPCVSIARWCADDLSPGPVATDPPGPLPLLGPFGTARGFEGGLAKSAFRCIETISRECGSVLESALKSSVGWSRK